MRLTAQQVETICKKLEEIETIAEAMIRRELDTPANELRHIVELAFTANPKHGHL